MWFLRVVIVTWSPPDLQRATAFAPPSGAETPPIRPVQISGASSIHVLRPSPTVTPPLVSETASNRRRLHRVRKLHRASNVTTDRDRWNDDARRKATNCPHECCTWRALRLEGSGPSAAASRGNEPHDTIANAAMIVRKALRITLSPSACHLDSPSVISMPCPVVSEKSRNIKSTHAKRANALRMRPESPFTSGSSSPNVITPPSGGINGLTGANSSLVGSLAWRNRLWSRRPPFSFVHTEGPSDSSRPSRKSHIRRVQELIRQTPSAR